MNSRGLGDGLDNDLGGSVPDGGFRLDRKCGRESSAESRGDSEGLEELGSHFDGGSFYRSDICDISRSTRDRQPKSEL